MALITIILAVFAKKYYDLERDECFSQLIGYTEQVGSEIRRTVEEDQSYLESISGLLEKMDFSHTRELESLLDNMTEIGMIARLELLLPGDRILSREGELSVAGKLSFEEEAAKGEHFCRRSSDPLYEDTLILRHCIPVEQNGETAAILCGVTELDQLPSIFSVKGYGPDMELYVVEGTTGNFLQDTWHETLGNMDSLGERETKKGYSWEQFHTDIRNGSESTIVFRSKTTGSYFYSYTAPVGVEDWMITLTVPEHIVFEKADNVLLAFLALAGIFALVFCGYFLWVYRVVRHENRRSEKQLKNISYMLDIEKELFGAYADPQHFRKALKKTADFLTAEGAFFWFDGKELKIKQSFWQSGEEDKALAETFTGVLPAIFAELSERGGFLAYRWEEFALAYPAVAGELKKLPIRNLMLLPVRGVSGKRSLVLGAYNMKHRWEDTEPLRQVSFSFLMAVNHYEDYRALFIMGQLDTLTGVKNRNSYHNALDAADAGEDSPWGCVYIDVNGLHEINNCLGHQAGDEMLITVAAGLRESFPEGTAYRIGGDEFVVLSKTLDEQELSERVEKLRLLLRIRNYEISCGTAYQAEGADLEELVRKAEELMRKDKQQFYERNGREHSMRILNRKVEQMILEKQDAENFLSVLAPDFCGVYFVNLKKDSLRYLFIPQYFEEILKETENRFSEALLEYAGRFVKEEYLFIFQEVCDYGRLEKKLDEMPKYFYQKLDGRWITLQILRFRDTSGTDKQNRETLWIFSESKKTEN